MGAERVRQYLNCIFMYISFPPDEDIMLVVLDDLERNKKNYSKIKLKLRHQLEKLRRNHYSLNIRGHVNHFSSNRIIWNSRDPTLKKLNNWAMYLIRIHILWDQCFAFSRLRNCYRAEDQRSPIWIQIEIKIAHTIYSSSSSPASPLPLAAFFLLTRPGAPPPYGELVQKSICFWESNRTMNDGTLTNCFRTL